MSTSAMKIVYNRRDAVLTAENTGNGKLFSEFVYDYLKKSHRPESYKRMYYVAVNHINGFAERQKQSVYTDSLSEQLLEEFVFYLQDEKNLMISTVKGIIERVKSMLQKAANAGCRVDGTFRDYTVHDEEINTIFLPMSDIVRILYFENLTKKQKEIRDYFIIGCLTGLRYSDYSRLTSENFVDGKIIIRTKKTKTPVQIPMHRFVKEILQRYNNTLPPARCIQYFNKAIKDICKKIGFVEELPYERRIGTRFVSVKRPKFSFISSHTARRSAATNMFLTGIQTFRIMLLTGHKTESAFFRYIRITREENAVTLSGHQFFN